MVVSLTIAALCLNQQLKLEADCDELRQAFSRAAILSNEKFRGVRVNLSDNELRLRLITQSKKKQKKRLMSAMKVNRLRLVLMSVMSQMC